MSGEEEWRPVVGWEGLYEVSSLGRVRSVPRQVERSGHLLTVRGRILVQTPSLGYPSVALSRDGKPVTKRVHVLACTAFHGPGWDGAEVAHADGTRTNNAAGNLRWVSAQENANDRIAHGVIRKGEDHFWAKRTADEVRAIRAYPGSHADAARAFGISYFHARELRLRLSWKHID